MQLITHFHVVIIVIDTFCSCVIVIAKYLRNRENYKTLVWSERAFAAGVRHH